MSQKNIKPERKAPKNVVLSPVCLALALSPVLKKDTDSVSESLKSSSHHHHRKVGKELFKDFQRENKHSFWNKPLAESVKDVGFLGFLEPWVILIKGSEKELECLREAYARRVLKPPKNFTIANLGDVQGIEMAPIQQHQFIPLTEVLCLIISEMNKRKLTATPDTIRDKLAECYSKMPVPNPEIIHKSLNHLVVERKIEQNGNSKGYMIVGLDKLPPESPSGDELENVVAKPKSKPVQQQQEDRVYLVYKDGELTRHALPPSSNMVDKSTQTVRSRSDSSSPRPVSYPANPNMGTIYEKSNTIGTSSPSKQQNMDSQASPLQRSNSMRERRSPVRRNNFDRTSSMRAKTNEIDTGYFTSDSEAKQSCFGRLLGKSAKKKAMAQTNMNHQTFSAQFPPSDIHDPFFNYAHWLGKSPQKVALNSVAASSPKISSIKDKPKSSGASPTHGTGTSTKKDGTKKVHAAHKDVNHYQVEHGRLTQTAKMLQQKYHENAQESMPESEQEFLKPTLMYDEKFRTKVVSEQIQPVKNTKKSDKIKHYFTSIQSNKPQQMQPFEGISTENDSEVEMQRRNDMAAEKRRQKLEQLKERRQARMFTPHRAVKESEMVDPMDYPAAGMKQPGSQVPSGSPGHPKSPGGGNANDMETPEPMRRQVMVMKRTETVEVKRAGLSPTSGPFPAALQTPKNYNSYRQPEPQTKYSDPTEHEQYYRDEEIDNYMREEQHKKLADDMQDPMCSPQRDTNGFSSYTQHQNSQVIVERREGGSQTTQAVNPRPMSLDNLDNERPPPPPPIRFNSQTDRSPGHQPPVHSVHPSHVYMQSPTGIHLEYPTQIPVHQRVESLSSSMGDSGFNSPRSSLAQSHNNNSPVDHLTSYDPLHSRHGVITAIPVLIKPIPRQTQNDLDNQNVDNSNRMIKSISNPTHLHSTFTKQVNPADLSVKRKFKSSDTVDASSDTSEKTAYSAMGRRSGLDRPKSFEVIGTV